MHRTAIYALALCTATVSTLAQAELTSTPTMMDVTQPLASEETAAFPIVVEGRRPGPGFWKVSKGDHVLWIFGLYAPLPKKLEWDDARALRLVKQSQELILPPDIDIQLSGIGSYFKAFIALPNLIDLKKNPERATLQDILPADVYARWLPLKAKYIGMDASVERLRPVFAANRLLHDAFEKNGLTSSNEIYARVLHAAETDEVTVTRTDVSTEIDEPGQAIREFKKAPLDDHACFIKTLDSLEGDITAMRTRANAWANGDPAALAHLNFAERDAECSSAVINSSAIKKIADVENLRLRARENWLKAADKALTANTSTFAMLPMRDILGPAGTIAALQAKGYAVQSPKQ